jgi:putative DNA primase/helicase
MGQMPSAIAQLAQLEIADARPPEFSDEALALHFAEKHADDLRYVAAWGKWFVWTGMYWRRDDTLFAFDLVRAVCRVATARAESAKTKRDLASAQTVASVERLAKADRRLAATVDQWDTDPWLLLNTPGGTVELRTGKLCSHRSDDYITKITAVTPRRGRRRRWLAFLRGLWTTTASLFDICNGSPAML